MARQLAVLLFASALVVAALAAEKPAPSFAAWLRKGSQTAGKLAGYSEEKDSYYYGSYYGVESQQICLKDAWHKYCRAGEAGVFGVEFFSTEAVCCGDESSYYGYGDSKVIDTKTLDPSVAATCDITSVTFFEKAITVVEDTTWKVGTAEITCTFKEPAEKCTGLSCDGVTITTDSTVYATWAYSHSPGYPLRHDEDCGSLAAKKKSTIAKLKTKGAAKVQSAKVQYEEEYKYKEEYKHQEEYYKHGEYKYEEEKKPTYLGLALVYTGPITSVNGGKEHKWVGGWYEQVTDFVGEKVETIEYEHAPWIHGNSYNIELLKSKDKY